jgi:putative ABC transport system permease protein
MNILVQDLRYALRGFSKSPLVSLIAVLTVGIGIGASVAVFSVVNAILIKQLPYPTAERVVIPWRLVPPDKNLGYDEIPWGISDVRLFWKESRSFAALGAFKSDHFTLTGTGDPQLLEGLRASSGFFQTLGVQPVIGRVFTSNEDQRGFEHEVLIGYQLWQEKFGADPGVVGKTIDLNGEVYSIVGVMPSGFAFPRGEEMPGSFEFPRQSQLWVPLALPSAPPSADAPDELAVVGLLKEGTSIAQAQAEMNVLAHEEDVERPRSKGWFNARVVPLTRQVVGNTREPLFLILAAVCAVLLVSCSNVANLQLARALGREKEFTLRSSLGASPARIVRQLMAESLLLACMGGVIGVVFAVGGILFVQRTGPSGIPRLHEVTLDIRMLCFALALTLVSGILCGLAPATTAIRINLVNALKESGARSGVGRSRHALRNGILLSQVAFALTLVIAAGLLVRSFAHLLSVNPGFNAQNVLTFELPLPESKYKSADQIANLYQLLLPKLRSVPGVQSAAVAEAVPMRGAGESTVIRILDQKNADQDRKPLAGYMIVSPSFFSTIGTPLLRGREFTESDTAHSIPVTIINEAMASKYWPGENPVGKQVGLGSTRIPPMTVIGMVADVKQVSLRDSAGPEMYVPFTQNPWPSMLNMEVVLRTGMSPTSAASGAQKVIHSMDGDLPIAKLASLQSLVDDSLAQARFSMLLMMVFGGVALVLASVGMYGVMSYATAQRTREIGIRMALGADHKRVFALVVGQGVRLACVGVALGLAGSLIVTRAMRNQLYGVSAVDPVTFICVSFLLLGVAFLACSGPARRATQIDPLVSLRSE